MPILSNFPSGNNKKVPRAAVVSAVGTEFALAASNTEISSVTEWATPTSPITNRERCCCYGNGYYVIAGISGDLAYSTDAVNWTKITAFTADVITGITYGKGRFLAIDSAGRMWVAEGAPINWTQVAATFTAILEAIVYANNRFVAVGDGGLVAFSDDGLTWTGIIIPFDFRAVTYGKGRYVAAGVNGSVAYSYDGTTWTDCSDASITGQYRAAAYGNDLFVIGGQDGIIRYSTDGINWTTATSNSTATISYIRAIQYAQGKFYAVMYTSSGGGEIWVSSDAETWTVQKQVAGRLWCIAEGNDILFASGDNGTIYTLDLGIVWYAEEPELVDGKYLWQRDYVMLSDGDTIVGESVCVEHANYLPEHSHDEYLTGYTETDPTVPAWAKAESKPTYTASEVGAISQDDLQTATDAALAQAKASGEFDGTNGVSCTHSWNGTTLSVTSASGTSSANLKGDKGDTGEVDYSRLQDYAQKTEVTAAVSEHNTSQTSHNDIRLLIEGLTSRLNALANSDDTTLDQMAEVVAYIKANRDLIDQITTGKVSVSDIVDNLTTNVINKPLSAAQGVALKALIDAITVPTKTSQLENDSGFLKNYTETDPTVPAWAKAASKPTYTASEVGALPLAGGKMTGEIAIGQGDGYGIQLGKIGRINATTSEGSTTATICGIDDTKALFGHSSFITTLRGKASRPTYNGNNMALQSDIPTDTNTTYTLSKSGTTITLTGSDGSTTSVTDADTNTTYSAATTSDAGLMSASDKSKLDGIASGANAYTHPTYTAKSSGLCKVTVDATGHVSATAPVAKSDITALGIPSTNTTYSAGTGISLSGTTFSNAGVRSIATGSSNGTISVNTNGTSADVAVKGLGSAAYTASTAYAASSHSHSEYATKDELNAAIIGAIEGSY